MNSILLIAALSLSTTNAPAAFEPTDPLRNPFWPVDYEYSIEDLESITTNPVVEVVTSYEDEGSLTAAKAKAAAELAKSSMIISSRTWTEATKELHFRGKTTIFNPETGKRKTAFYINGNTYGIGDLISVNHNGRRFTWRIQQRTDMETLKLEQVRVISLPDEDNDTKEGK